MGHFGVRGKRVSPELLLSIACPGPGAARGGYSDCVPPTVHGVHRGAALHEVPRLQHPDTGHQVQPCSPAPLHPQCHPEPPASPGLPPPQGPVERGGTRGQGLGGPCPMGPTLRAGTGTKGTVVDQWVERGEGRWPRQDYVPWAMTWGSAAGRLRHPELWGLIPPGPDEPCVGGGSEEGACGGNLTGGCGLQGGHQQTL